jgi:PAS domain S-box-containing protein
VHERWRESITIKLGVSAALTLLVGIAVTSVVRMNRFADAAQWVSHTYEVIGGLDAVLSGITDAETTQRGFLLSGDERDYQRYQRNKAALAARIQAVKKLSGDNPVQLQRIAQVEQLIARRILLLEEGVQAKRMSPDRLQLTRVHFAEGREAMDGVRRGIAEMDNEERRLLAARTAALEHDRFTAKLILVLGNAVALMLLLASMAVMVREIRQRKQAEMQTRRYVAQVEDLYNAAPCGYHSLDSEGVIVQINDTELAWLGYAREEIVNRTRFVDLLTPASSESFAANFVTFKRQGTAHDLEYDLVRKDGTILPVSLSATLVRDAAGEYVMSRSTLFDITERRRTSQELHRANVFLDSVVEHIPSMIFVKDASTLQYVRFNRAGEALLGLPRSALLGKGDRELFPAAQAQSFIEQDRTALSSGAMLDVAPEVLQLPSGERIVHTRKLPILDEQQRPQYLLGISEDVTERHRAERQIHELHQALEMRAQQLEATNSELESFSYSVSHDLRSPLRAIDGFSRILEEDHADALDDEGLRLLSVIRGNARRMAQLIDDLLTLSRLGRQALTRLVVNMDALVRETWESLREGESLVRAHLILDRLPDAIGDPVLLRQVWANLLSNAIKYSGTREQPLVTVSARTNAEQVIYCVSDNGVGFDMRYADKLFGVFQRLHSMDEFPGTGVGLAIVKRVVARHGGRVWAESALAEGARFFFSLPQRPADERV